MYAFVHLLPSAFTTNILQPMPDGIPLANSMGSQNIYLSVSVFSTSHIKARTSHSILLLDRLLINIRCDKTLSQCCIRGLQSTPESILILLKQQMGGGQRVCLPVQVLGDVNHYCPINSGGLSSVLLISVIHYQFLGFGSAELEVVILTPGCQSLELSSVHRLVAGDEVLTIISSYQQI